MRYRLGSLHCVAGRDGVGSLQCVAGRGGDSLHRRVELERDTRPRRPIYFIDTWRSLRGVRRRRRWGLFRFLKTALLCPWPRGHGGRSRSPSAAPGLRAAPKSSLGVAGGGVPFAPASVAWFFFANGRSGQLAVFHVGHREVFPVTLPLSDYKNTSHTEKNVASTNTPPHLTVARIVGYQEIPENRVFVHYKSSVAEGPLPACCSTRMYLVRR